MILFGVGVVVEVIGLFRGGIWSVIGVYDTTTPATSVLVPQSIRLDRVGFLDEVVSAALFKLRLASTY